jgi:uncharacterized repeat protein (TIGR04138 family)
MPDANENRCDLCGKRAHHITHHAGTTIVRSPGGKWKIEGAEGGTKGVQPTPSGKEASTTTRLCRACYLKRATPDELAIHEAMENGCTYCGAPASSAGRDPEGGVNAQCRSCTKAYLDFILRAAGLDTDQLKTREDRMKAMKELIVRRVLSLRETRAEALQYLRGRRVRYAPEAYPFVRDVIRNQVRLETANVSAAMLDALRRSAIKKFGFNARAQLREWGITRCEDFGEIVFRLVEERLLNVGPGDKRENFSGGYVFETAFPMG